MDNVRICPRCGNEYIDYPAISRTDNETEICPACGMDEAFEDYFGLPRKWTPPKEDK